ncbi:MAG: hypothetical protein OXF94_13060 [Gammaproteobacteria bacterium]|nr:hypothetical protein [Gammaproteobacteria bacterium]
MTGRKRDPVFRRSFDAHGLLAEAAHLQAIEENPLSPDELAMFDMFERERWAPEDRRASIERQFRGRERTAAAE